ncbi:MAG: Rieske (2Fe-2S) protein [Candidatus Sumerlaeaceae bacterium]|jgi:nitrite reductase/ring-hydroxylating ferredoxin subunit
MTLSPPWIPVARLAELETDGATKTFSFRDASGYMLDGFAIRFAGKVHAYLNRCPHLPLSLDYGDGEFFDEDKQWLVCRNHGAIFEPATGKCVAGPCCGAHLRRLNVRVVGDVVAIEAPAFQELD